MNVELSTEEIVGMSEVADIDEITEPSEIAVDVAPPPDGDELIDSSGTVFDPEVHAVKRDGSPSYTKSGRFRKVRRPNGAANKLEAEPEDHRYRVAAEGTVAAIEMLGVMLGGDAFRYIKDKKSKIDERAAGVDAWSAYFEAHDIDDFPPGIVVAIWALTYAAPRFGDPTVRQRFAAFGTRLVKGAKRLRKWFKKA